MTLKEYIDYEIIMAGGRIKLASEIMIENAGFFTYREHQEMKNRLSKQLSRDRKKRNLPHKCKWTKEDFDYLYANWGFKKSSALADDLERTVASCRQAFMRKFGVYEYKQRVSEGIYKFIKQC